MKAIQDFLQNPNVKKLINLVTGHLKRVNIGSEAAALTYFFLLSIFPILMVIANVIPLLPIPVDQSLATVEQFIPENIATMVLPILKSYLTTINGGAIGIGLLVVIWPASQILSRIQTSLNAVYDAPPMKNAIISRLFSFVIALVGLVFLAAMTFAFVFGENIIRFIQDRFSLPLEGLLNNFLALRWVGFALVILLVMSGAYALMPNIRRPFRYSLPGGLVTMLGFIAISQLFTLYISFAGKNFSANGAFGSAIVFMVWLYLSNTVFLYGGLVNVLIYEWFHPQEDYSAYLPKERAGETWYLPEAFPLESLRLRPLRGALYLKKGNVHEEKSY